MSANNTQLEATTEAGLENEGLAASLGLNGQLFTFQLINFALVFLTLWFMILKPLTKKMEERKRLIDESIDKAKKVEENLLHSEQKFQEKIDEAKVEANAIMQKAHGEAEGMSEKMKLKAREEIELLITQAKRNIEIDKEDMRLELRKETVELVILTVEKLIGEKLDAKKDEKFIQEILESKTR